MSAQDIQVLDIKGDFPTRFQNGHSSRIDNIFVDKSIMQSYEIFPLSNALSDHEAKCIILNIYIYIYIYIYIFFFSRNQN